VEKSEGSKEMIMNYKYKAIIVIAVFVILLYMPLMLSAQAGTGLAGTFEQREALITMRDGVRLNTIINIPKGAEEPLPFIIVRTPYGIGSGEVGARYKELADDGYIFVFQDIRGRYGSDGQFVMMRPPRNGADPHSIDEGTDTYDTVDWLLKNIPGHNGRVGIMGISYGGWLTVMGMLEPHPAVKAVSPQASPADMYLGDDFLHNGALRLAPAFGYAAMMETGKTTKRFDFDQRDAFEFFLDLGPLSNANKKYLHGRVPSWNNFMEHPNYDEYWKRISVIPYLKSVTVPTLNVAGWWDAEDFYGPMKIYELLEQFDTNDESRLVAGPWRHGGWARTDGSALWEIEFDSNTSEYFKKNVQAPFFAYYLKDKGELDLPEALIFLTGENRWERHDSWPPVNLTEERRLYFRADGMLSFEPPGGLADMAFDSYVSDPAKPVPYTKRPMNGFWQGAQAYWKVEDQRFVHLRPDVLSWETVPLEEDIVVSGRIIANLFASTTGTDSDWIVKVIDVYPEDYEKKPDLRGYQLMIADDVLRARFRNGFEKPEPLTSGAIVKYEIDLNSRSHCFKKGHRIMVQVQSTWFPLIGRNPQTFVNIPTATESDYRAAEQRIYRTGSYPSHILLPVVR